MLRVICLMASGLLLSASVFAAEIHVAKTGNDANPGSQTQPLQTIQKAAELAMPGDTVIVHEGVYRERVNPPRGGESDNVRIVYQAAPGEKVEIKGSEIVKGWEKVGNDTWKVALPNTFFGDFNPFKTLIVGDWFNPLGREHHLGAVYWNGHWLIEAEKLDDVLAPYGEVNPLNQSNAFLLNIAWLQAGRASRVAASGYTTKNETGNAPCSEGDDCVGWITRNSWLCYEKFNFGRETKRITFRSASASAGGVIEMRLNDPKGEIIGSCVVPNTGGWQNWNSFSADIKPTAGVQKLYLTFSPMKSHVPNTGLWYAKVDDSHTTIWAQFKDRDPNAAQVEVNVRQSVFYPDQPGRNYITVRGFTMRQAATPWSPPTTEQIGLIGTHWSKGWIIEDNIISHSTCTGITLGKYGEELDWSPSESAEGYVKTIKRAHAFRIPWTREHIGHHLVRGNTISHCEQSGLVGSMGAAFCTIEDNTIHDIHIRRLFDGAEQAGIKIHGAIDTTIRRNHIYRSGSFGIWLDWMAQGTRVSSHLFHDNACDLFVEVNHGPFLIDNNLLLSPISVRTWSRGGAYVHNLFMGTVEVANYDGRRTPFHKRHSTEVIDLHDNPKGDDRYINNVFSGPADLRQYDDAMLPVVMQGNVFRDGAVSSKWEAGGGPAATIVERSDGFYINVPSRANWFLQSARRLVTTELLGETVVSDAVYDNPDGTPLKIDTDYFGKPRAPSDPTPGPFEKPIEELSPVFTSPL